MLQNLYKSYEDLRKSSFLCIRRFPPSESKPLITNLNNDLLSTSTNFSNSGGTNSGGIGCRRPAVQRNYGSNMERLSGIDDCSDTHNISSINATPFNRASSLADIRRSQNSINREDEESSVQQHHAIISVSDETLSIYGYKRSTFKSVGLNFIYLTICLKTEIFKPNYLKFV